ncbi:MAG: hypothetical protein CMN91_11505 [Synechococcus sp. ARS1019]|nr:hypothetical protein [Synechococcus sp. ARS1019]
MHSLARLLVQGTVQDRMVSSVASRRWLQRQRAAQQLMDQPIKGWNRPRSSGEMFWRWLRWGGGGLVLGWLLAQATSSGRS